MIETTDGGGQDGWGRRRRSSARRAAAEGVRPARRRVHLSPGRLSRLELVGVVTRLVQGARVLYSMLIALGSGSSREEGAVAVALLRSGLIRLRRAKWRPTGTVTQSVS
jgi:hypothetical protein